MYPEEICRCEDKPQCESCNLLPWYCRGRFICLVEVGAMGERDRLDGVAGNHLPLAFTGQEAIWQKVFQVSGVSRAYL